MVPIPSRPLKVKTPIKRRVFRFAKRKNLPHI